MGNHIVIVETLTSGTGLELVEAARHKANQVTFLTRDKDRYVNDPRRAMLDSGEVEVQVCETKSADVLTTAFTELRRGGEIVLVAPNEQYLLDTAIAAQRADIPFLSEHSVRLAQDKHAFRRACTEAGIPAPRSQAASDVDTAVALAEEIGYPVVLKPSVGTGSYGVVSAADAEEVRERFPAVLAESELHRGVPLVEEFVVGPVVSAEVLYVDGVPQVLGISDRLMSEIPYFLELAIRFPVELGADTHERIVRDCADMAAMLEYEFGPAHVEFALTADGPKVIEFNPRFAGRNVSRLVSAALDWNVYAGIIDTYLGEQVTPPAPVRAAAENALYAKTGGRFEGVTGMEMARRVPGVQDIRIFAQPGAALGSAQDQRSEYGLLWCTGATTAEAGMRAASAAGYLSPVVVPD